MSGTNGYDINAETMTHTPLSTQIPLLITDLNNTAILQVNQKSIMQALDTTITCLPFPVLNCLILILIIVMIYVFFLLSSVPCHSVSSTYLSSLLELGIHNNSDIYEDIICITRA